MDVFCLIQIFAVQILREHPELESFIGFDVDPVAHSEAKPRLQAMASSDVQLHLVLTNFRNIKKAVNGADAKLVHEGVNGILMDLGMSSMQVRLLCSFSCLPTWVYVYLL